MTYTKKIVNLLKKAKAFRNRTAHAEDRDSPRYNVTLLVKNPDAEVMVERRGNVSIGGFCLEASTEYAPGAKLDLLCRLPGMDRVVMAKGEVLGTVQYPGWAGIRGRFTEIDLPDELVLARWLDDMTLTLMTCAA